MINFRLRASLLVIATVLAFGSPAVAAPSDWADVIDHNPKKKIPYDRSRSVDRPPVKSAKSTKVAKADKAEKKAKGKKKAKKAPRRGKAKSRR